MREGWKRLVVHQRGSQLPNEKIDWTSSTKVVSQESDKRRDDEKERMTKRGQR